MIRDISIEDDSMVALVDCARDVSIAKVLFGKAFPDKKLGTVEISNEHHPTHDLWAEKLLRVEMEAV